MHRRHHGRGYRSRRRIGPDEWAVRARVERFVEPTLLLLLRERPRHGYELIELLPELAGGERVDVGNLYRFLRARWVEALRRAREDVSSFLARYDEKGGERVA